MEGIHVRVDALYSLRIPPYGLRTASPSVRIPETQFERLRFKE